ncbi:MAG: arginine--tRNA ligase [bacterium]|nr:arginine--tRNA ligase [bacterium]
MLVERFLKDLKNIVEKNFSVGFNFEDHEILSFTDFGDISTNISFQLSKRIKKNPLKIAEEISEKLEKDYGYKSEPVKPGFLNVFFDDKEIFKECEKMVSTERYGKKKNNNKKVNIEFISANPTGPLVLVNLRAGVSGNMLFNVLKYSGYDVERENYINDAGKQIYNFGASILYHIAKNKPENFPENGYRGNYVEDISKKLKEKIGEVEYNDEYIKKAADFGKEFILNWQKESLNKYSIDFENWIFESEVRKKYLDSVLKKLSEKGYTYSKDNALYLKTTLFGDDKDRVIIKSNGEYTYFLPDIAYHFYKIERGFNRIIDILGPDHHGYIPRVQAAIKMVSERDVRFDVIIAQLVTIFKDGQKYEMSKRTGEFITLDELSEEIDPDVLKFTILSRKLSQPFNFDIEKVKEKSMDNPVYYVQYCYARLSSLFDKAGVDIKDVYFDYEIFENKDLRKIAKKLIEFPYIVYNISNSYELQKLPNYLIELSSLIHQFYHDYRIIEENRKEMIKKISVLFSAREILKIGLSLMGITIKERMYKDEV